jgi:hypothetical protein
MAEAASAPLTLGKFCNHIETDWHDRYDNQLGDPVARLDPERFTAAIPA